VPESQSVTDFMRDEITQVVVPVRKTALVHGAGWNEDLGVQYFARQRIPLDVRR
jgi:hypothetical protein